MQRGKTSQSYLSRSQCREEGGCVRGCLHGTETGKTESVCVRERQKESHECVVRVVKRVNAGHRSVRRLTRL